MPKRNHPEMIQAQAAMLRDEIRRIDTGTADEIRSAYYQAADNIEALSTALSWIRHNHREDQLPFLASHQLTQHIKALEDALADLGAFGLAL
ncbi:hypothetical protein ACJJJB_00265 (plasmid) [Microbulbifer sp. ANSA001]|uniref:hypothetical protein n=1 Tax=Microbulbifer sp. ANSA001 TaxID=3243358 RepID=UPI004042A141